MEQVVDMVAFAKGFGFEDVQALDPACLRFYPEVRAMCEQNRCGRYDKSWSCPPACGELPLWEARVLAYQSGVLVQSYGSLESSFDFETMQQIEQTHKDRFLRFMREAKSIYPNALPLGSGSCTLCQSCTYPGEPCRLPALQVISMEACGLAVFEVCENCGTSLWHGENTVAYAACLLY